MLSRVVGSLVVAGWRGVLPYGNNGVRFGWGRGLEFKLLVTGPAQYRFGQT